MDIQIFEGKHVVHRLYGEGEITSIDDSKADVLFESQKQCKFLMPSCFNGFLRMVEEEDQLLIDELLNKWKTDNNIYWKEQLQEKTKKTQAGIEKRGIQREIRRKKRAEEEAKRNIMRPSKNRVAAKSSSN